VTERKRVTRTQPAMLGYAAGVCFANFNHDELRGNRV
jgi:hypothetical protein